MDLTWFYDDVKDALWFVPPPPPPPTFANIGHYANTGPEVSAEVSPMDNLKFFVGSTYSHTTPSEVPNVPEWTAIAGAAWSPVKPVTLHVDFEWVDRRYVLDPRFPGTQMSVREYYLLNMRGDYHLNKHIMFFVAGSNLLDYDYEFRPGYPMPGASVMGGVELTL